MHIQNISPSEQGTASSIQNTGEPKQTFPRLLEKIQRSAETVAPPLTVSEVRDPTLRELISLQNRFSSAHLTVELVSKAFESATSTLKRFQSGT